MRPVFFYSINSTLRLEVIAESNGTTYAIRHFTKTDILLVDG
jgi:hypothetical protein